MQQKTVHISRLVIGAPKGSSDKSAVTMGLLAALVSTRWLKVELYKKEEDFIDLDWLARTTGRPCRNLDSIFMSREVIRQTFIRHAVNVDLGIVEGIDGLYDGVDQEGSGSTAEIAKAIQAPVILVVDTERITRSILK